MLLKREWAERFIQACGLVKSARRRSFGNAHAIYLTPPKAQCWVVKTGYVKLSVPRADGGQFIRLILGRGGFFGDQPFGVSAFHGFVAPQPEHAVAHGPVDVLELDRSQLESALAIDLELAGLMLESATSRALFLERRLMWQFITPVRARIAATLRDLICFEGNRCRHGHTIDVRLTHQELAELVGAARPVISAELVRLKQEGIIEYTRSYFCVDDLAKLDRAAGG
jgi:CRP-like cAMP-binding protein